MRILVAEDDAPLADFLRQRLVQEQFAVQFTSDGIEAQRQAANQAFDLVILEPDLPVMVMTGSSVVEERVRGLDCRGRRLCGEAVCVRRAGGTDTCGLAAGKPSRQCDSYGG